MSNSFLHNDMRQLKDPGLSTTPRGAADFVRFRTYESSIPRLRNEMRQIAIPVRDFRGATAE